MIKTAIMINMVLFTIAVIIFGARKISAKRVLSGMAYVFMTNISTDFLIIHQ